jgi:hypothetical protein
MISVLQMLKLMSAVVMNWYLKMSVVVKNCRYEKGQHFRL